jgi:hypothetical protein
MGRRSTVTPTGQGFTVSSPRGGTIDRGFATANHQSSVTVEQPLW